MAWPPAGQQGSFGPQNGVPPLRADHLSWTFGGCPILRGGLIQTLTEVLIQTLMGGGLIQTLRGGGLFIGLFGPSLERKYSVFADGLCHRPGALPTPHSRQRPTGRVNEVITVRAARVCVDGTDVA